MKQFYSRFVFNKVDLKTLCINLSVSLFILILPLHYAKSQGINGISSGNQNQIGLPSGSNNGFGSSIGGGIGSMNGGLSSLGSVSIRGQDPFIQSNTKIPIPIFQPLQPNDYQKYILQITGHNYPLYGYSFFENIRNFESDPASLEKDNAPLSLSSLSTSQYNSPFAPQLSSPVPLDYILNSGDQLLVRAWGSIDVNYQATIDRSGSISLPKIGTIQLGGVKFSQAESIINKTLSKFYKNFEINVSMGQMKSITIYVVGQARRPGSYTLSSLSTLSSALFASGGPNNIGSMRRVQLKRGGNEIAELDLYDFLSRGKSDKDLRLNDGDVIVIPPSFGYVALTGKINTPAIYELKNEKETLEQMIVNAGGLSVTASPLIATIERLDQTQKQPRKVINIGVNEQGLLTALYNGDWVNFFGIIPEVSNAVTLRGNVSQSMKFPWKLGMRVQDLIPNREFLISRESVRLQNEVLFDANQRERTQRDREQIPLDLLIDPIQQIINSKPTVKSAQVPVQPINNLKLNQLPSALDLHSVPDSNDWNVVSLERWQQQRESRLLSQQSKIDDFKPKTITDRLGQLMDEVNFDYAVVERFDRRNLSVTLIPFNLGIAIDNPNSIENIALEIGDVITVFSQNDIRVPVSKRRILVKVEGEVKNPGIYQASPGDTIATIVKRAGGLTPEAFLFGASFHREEVRKTQFDNLLKLLNRLESESSSSLAQISQSSGASSDAAVLQAKIMAAQQTQKQSIERLRNLRPEGRIALGITPNVQNDMKELPDIHLQNNDRLVIPAKPDFVYVYGSVNTESALLFKRGWTVSDYLATAGVGTGADRDGLILIRADGTAKSSNGSWFSNIMSSEVLPGDTIVIPEKLDRESAWSSVFRNTRDVTQIFYQLGLGAAAIKTLRN